MNKALTEWDQKLESMGAQLNRHFQEVMEHKTNLTRIAQYQTLMRGEKALSNDIRSITSTLKKLAPKSTSDHNTVNWAHLIVRSIWANYQRLRLQNYHKFLLKVRSDRYSKPIGSLSNHQLLHIEEAALLERTNHVNEAYQQLSRYFDHQDDAFESLKRKYANHKTALSNRDAANSLNFKFGSNFERAMRHPTLIAFSRYLGTLFIVLRNSTTDDRWHKRLVREYQYRSSKFSLAFSQFWSGRVRYHDGLVDEKTRRHINQTIKDLNRLSNRIQQAKQHALDTPIPDLHPRVVK